MSHRASSNTSLPSVLDGGSGAQPGTGGETLIFHEKGSLGELVNGVHPMCQFLSEQQGPGKQSALGKTKKSHPMVLRGRVVEMQDRD